MINIKDFTGKVGVITGAGSGIGRALALALVKEGAQLALCDINEGDLKETRDLVLNIKKSPVETYVFDVSNREQAQKYSQQIIEKFGVVDVLVNNAGVAAAGSVIEMDYEMLEWVLNVNMWGVIHMTKSLLPVLLERPEASLVNVSSVFGLVGIVRQSAYCTSKFAVRGFSESLRQELKETGVAVSVVFPGGVKTNISKNSRPASSIQSDEYEKLKARFEKTLVTSPDRAAELIIEGIKRKSPRILIGSDARRIDWMARLIPNSFDRIILKAYESMRS